MVPKNIQHAEPKTCAAICSNDWKILALYIYMTCIFFHIKKQNEFGMTIQNRQIICTGWSVFCYISNNTYV